MKRILSAVLVLTVAFTSCKKSDDAAPAVTASMTATIDNVATTYATVTAQKNTSGTSNTVTVGGVLGSTLLTVSIVNPTGAVTAGTYPSGTNTATLTWASSNPVSMYSSNVGAGATVTNPVQVVITSIDATSVKGTFKGQVFLNGSTTTSKNITSGSFEAAFQ